MADVTVVKDLDAKRLVIKYVASGSLKSVWQAFTQQDLFVQWWGPEGWETSVKKFDFRVGGHVHYDMHCTDANQVDWYDMHSWGIMEILDIVDRVSFTYKDYFTDETGVPNLDMPATTSTNTFTEENGKTRITTVCTADTAEQIEELLNMGMVQGYASMLDCLNALLTTNN